MTPRYLYNFLLAAALLFSNLGLAINIHYCGTEIEKVELGYAASINCAEDTHEKACCKEKNETDKKDCCKNETIKQKTDEVIKVFTTQLSADFITPVVYKFQPIVISKNNLPKKINATFRCESNAPPLYKLYSQYLLYA